MATGWSEKDICDAFRLENLTENQRKSIEALYEGNDVFVGTATGSGKSLTYECIPLIMQNVCVVVVAPLLSIMEEQCSKLTACGFTATMVGKDPAEEEQLQRGDFQFLFGSPETLVGNQKYRDLIQSKVYQKKLGLIVVDEAHTVIQWGEAKKGEDPFREWFSRIGELRSLCVEVPLVALTATSSPQQRRKIMRQLCFRPKCVVVVDSPDRPNIKITSVRILNNADPAETFIWLMNGLSEEHEKFRRHVIFCPTIAECSRLYGVFIQKFGRESGLFNMYHSKTVDQVKDSIRQDMGNADGRIRILICTNAAGMGVNFSNVQNLVHYGLPRELDTFVQQMGRAGRDGSQSEELVLWKAHKGHLKRVEEELVKLVKEESLCRHRFLCELYSSDNVQITPKHNCCDFCAQSCKCGQVECPRKHPYLINQSDDASDNEEEEHVTFVRNVTSKDRQALKHRLIIFKHSLEESNIGLLPSELLHGLTSEAVDKIVTECCKIFTPDDVLSKIPCWSYETAKKLSNIINTFFGDHEVVENESSDESDFD